MTDFFVGQRLRIKPEYEKEKERGIYYLINAIKNGKAFIGWENYYNPKCKPFWIKLNKLEKCN